MPRGEGLEPHKLEDLKSKLFSKNYKSGVEHHDGFSPMARKEVPDSWDEDENVAGLRNKIIAKTSMFKRIFIVSVVFFIFSLSYAAYVFFAGSNTVSNDNIDIAVTGNNFTAGGEALDLIISITNRNNTSLDLADLVVEYPKGAQENSATDIERLRATLGTIPAGAVRNENLKLILFGEQGSVRPIDIILEYRVAGSNAIFVKEKVYKVSINSTPISLLIEGPKNASPNQDINLKVQTTLNSTRPAENILLKLDYPLGFQFVKAQPVPSFGDNVWYLGDLAPGAEHSVEIFGKMIDVFDGEEKIFNVSSGSQSRDDKSKLDVVFSSAKHLLEIKKPFMEAGIYINGVSQREFAVKSKSPISVQVRYANNLSTRIDDVVIEARVSGNAWNRAKLRTISGFYDSSRNMVTWNKNYKQALASMDPGDSDSVNFSLEPLELYSSTAGLLADPTINIEVNIFGRQSAEDASVNELKNSASAVIRLISDLGFSAKALYYSGPFQNSGPIPPKAEEITTYTIVWTLSNTANSISRAELKSSLPAWVSYVGKFSPAGENISYNTATREIVWKIDRIPKGSGLSSESRSVSFQIAFKPSLSQVGATPTIIHTAVLTGHDDFANVDVRVEKPGLNTFLTGDSQFPGTGGAVAP